MGFSIPTAEMGSSISHLTSLLAGTSLYPDDKHGIDHGSNYAKSLGFDLEMDWPDEEIEVSKNKKKKSKKKVRDSPGLHRLTLSQKKNQKKKNLNPSSEDDEVDEDEQEYEAGMGNSDSSRENSDEPALQSSVE